MSPQRVLKEIKYLVNDLGVKEIRIDDDTFDIDRNRVIEICKLLVEEKLDFTFSVQCRPQLMTDEEAKWLKRAGCRMVLYGVESGNDEILKKIRKNTTKDEIRRGVRIEKHGLDVLNCVMLGFYWDTRESVEDTIRFAFELNAEFTQYLHHPLPGTDYYQLLTIITAFLPRNGNSMIVFTTLLLNCLFNKCRFKPLSMHLYRRYYRRPRYLWMMFWRMFKTWGNFSQSIRKFSVLLPSK